jgi:hypothetical protein
VIEIRSLNVVTSCIRTVPLRVRFVKLGCPLELVVVVSEVCAGGDGTRTVGWLSLSLPFCSKIVKLCRCADS